MALMAVLYTYDTPYSIVIKILLLIFIKTPAIINIGKAYSHNHVITIECVIHALGYFCYILITTVHVSHYNMLIKKVELLSYIIL